MDAIHLPLGGNEKRTPKGQADFRKYSRGFAERAPIGRARFVALAGLIGIFLAIF
jgi:hypothetical protein